MRFDHLHVPPFFSNPMKIDNIEFLPKQKVFEAASLEEAHKLGYFTGSMTRYEFMDRITRKNPSLRWYANERGMGLWDSNKGEDNRSFICGITRYMTIPRYSITKYDKTKDRVMNYSDAEGNITHREIIHTDEEEGIILARGWEATFKVIKGHGYEIDETDLY